MSVRSRALHGHGGLTSIPICQCCGPSSSSSGAGSGEGPGQLSFVVGGTPGAGHCRVAAVPWHRFDRCSSTDFQQGQDRNLNRLACYSPKPFPSAPQPPFFPPFTSSSLAFLHTSPTAKKILCMHSLILPDQIAFVFMQRYPVLENFFFFLAM